MNLARRTRENSVNVNATSEDQVVVSKVPQRKLLPVRNQVNDEKHALLHAIGRVSGANSRTAYLVVLPES